MREAVAMSSFFHTLWYDDKGQDIAEYAVIVFPVARFFQKPSSLKGWAERRTFLSRAASVLRTFHG
jgi:hypothetical protein